MAFHGNPGMGSIPGLSTQLPDTDALPPQDNRLDSNSDLSLSLPMDPGLSTEHNLHAASVLS